MIHTTLVSAAQLHEAMQAVPKPVVLDASFDLADVAAGERSWREAHVPGAHHVHLDRDLAGPRNGRNGRHPLPSRDAFARTAGALGIRPETQVVVYDRQQAAYASRAWWMLRWLGHRPVAVLDGGWAAWTAVGGAVESGEIEPAAAAAYPMSEPLVRTIDADGLGAQLGRIRLLDARAPERFRGEVEPLDAQAGHIPGALNRFFKDNLGPDGRFKPASQLRDEFQRLLALPESASLVHQCGSGVTACHNLLAMEVAGLGTGLLYPGSWSEWSADPARPLAKG